MNWCARKGIGPAAVDDAVVQLFLHWLETRTLHPGRAAVREPSIWNKARGAVRLARAGLARLSFRPVSAISPGRRFPDAAGRGGGISGAPR